MGFKFATAFKLPTKVINDAAMQRLATSRGGKMWVLALGTAPGSLVYGDGNGRRASCLEGPVRPFSEDRPLASARALCSRPQTRRALDGRSSRTLPRLFEEPDYR